MALLSEIFTIDYGNGFDLNKMETTTSGVNFVSRTAKNNAVSACVKKYKDIEPYEAGLITVALGGTVLTSCVQIKPFYTGQNVAILTPINEMTIQEKLYYCYCIKMNNFRYTTCGREANSTLKLLELPSPDDIPEWVKNTEIKDISYYKESLIHKEPFILDTKHWRHFKVNKIFERIEPCKSINAGDLEIGNDIWYIGAKKDENGTIKTVKMNKELVTEGNCIVFIQNGQGSAGFANYMDKDFIGSRDLSVGYSKFLDKYVGLFLVTMFDVERYRYGFGRKWNGERLKNSTILLPTVTDENGIPIINEDGEFTPDYKYMRDYIQRLPFTKMLI